jgi:hypothetical protein
VWLKLFRFERHSPPVAVAQLVLVRVKESDVVMFVGEAVAQADNSLHYPTGQKHAAILFLRQETGSAPDWARATTELERRGWSDVSLAKASSASIEALDSVHPHASASYQEAAKDGFAAVIFSEPINPTL